MRRSFICPIGSFFSTAVFTTIVASSGNPTFADDTAQTRRWSFGPFVQFFEDADHDGTKVVYVIAPVHKTISGQEVNDERTIRISREVLKDALLEARRAEKLRFTAEEQKAELAKLKDRYHDYIVQDYNLNERVLDGADFLTLGLFAKIEESIINARMGSTAKKIDQAKAAIAKSETDIANQNTVVAAETAKAKTLKADIDQSPYQISNSVIFRLLPNGKIDNVYYPDSNDQEPNLKESEIRKLKGAGGGATNEVMRILFAHPENSPVLTDLSKDIEFNSSETSDDQMKRVVDGIETNKAFLKKYSDEKALESYSSAAAAYIETLGKARQKWCR